MNTSQVRQMLNKVPEVTLYFWIIKILCTTIGETAADFLNTTLNLGLNGTSFVMGVLLVVVLFFQFKAKKYIPSIYWLAVVLLSVVGTLITDNLTDNLGISLETTTIVFSIALAVTFALGTAAGDLSAEKFNLGYLNSLFIFAGLIGVITIAHYIVRGFLAIEHRYQSTNAVLAFWLAYILTRPLGASIGDYLSQARDDGGLGLGTAITSGLFLATILATVIYLTVTKKDAVTLTS